MIGATLLAAVLAAPLPQAAIPDDPAARLAAACAGHAQKSEYATRLRENRLSDSLWDNPALPRWEELACLRGDLAVRHIDVPRGEAPEMPDGRTWFDGAVAAFLRLMREHPGADLLDPAIQVTRLALREPKQSLTWDLADDLAAMVFLALRNGDRRAVLAEACPRLLLAVSDTASARECLRLGGADALALPPVQALAPALDMLPGLYRLWNPVSREPVVLVTFGLRQHIVEELRPIMARQVGPKRAATMSSNSCIPARSMGERTTSRTFRCDRLPREPILLTTGMTAWNHADGRWQQAGSPPQTLSVTRGGPEDIQVAGFRFFTIPPGGASWSIAFRSTAPGVGGRFAVDRLVARDSSALYLSDIVLGSPTRGRRVPVGSDTIWTLPWREIDHESELFFYVQTGSDRARPKLTTSLRITERKDDRSGDAPAIQLEFPTPVVAGLTGRQRGIDIRKLKQGSYRLELTVQDPATGASAREETVLVVR